MTKKLMITMTALASAVVLMFPGAASADHVSSSRTVTGTYEFPSLGQGDVGGFCLNQPSTVPGTGSCVAATPEVPVAPSTAVEDHVDITVVDDTGEDVYFTVQQDGGEFGWGCGSTLFSHPNGFPILGLGTGGNAAPDVVVFPWAGPGLNDGVTICEPGSTNLAGGEVTFVFQNHVAP